MTLLMDGWTGIGGRIHRSMIDLAAETDRLLDFAEGSRHPEGGFAWLRADGTPDLDRPRELWITTRMTHVFALGVLLGRPGAAELVEHGLDVAARRLPRRRARRLVRAGRRLDRQARLRARLRRAGGGRRGRRGAAGRGARGARRRTSGTSARARWSTSGTATGPTLEAYRGANANMHGVEAMLATEDPLWRERAVRVTQRLVVDNHPRAERALRRRVAAAAGLQHRRARRIPFRPYGATIGHWFEWARLAFTLDAASRPTRGGCSRPACRTAGTAPGSSTPSTGTASRSSPTGCTGCCARRSRAAAVLGEDALQAEWWERGRARLHRSATTAPGATSSTPSNRPASSVWDGKPDVYHALQATLIPRLPVAPSLAASCASPVRRRRHRRRGDHQRERGEADEQRERLLRQRLLEDDRAGGDRDHVGGRARERDHRHDRADLQRARGDRAAPTRLSTTMISANGWRTTAGPRSSVLPVSALIVMSEARPQQAGGDRQRGAARAAAREVGRRPASRPPTVM